MNASKTTPYWNYTMSIDTNHNPLTPLIISEGLIHLAKCYFILGEKPRGQELVQEELGVLETFLATHHEIFVPYNTLRV